MFLITKKIKYDLIELQYNNKYKFYKILYNQQYIKLIGLSYKIKINDYQTYNNVNYKLYIDNESIQILLLLENYLNNFISNFKILNIEDNIKSFNNIYIYCKKYSKKNISKKSELNIIIYKIKYRNHDDCFIPIINIV